MFDTLQINDFQEEFRRKGWEDVRFLDHDAELPEIVATHSNLQLGVELCLITRDICTMDFARDTYFVDRRLPTVGDVPTPAEVAEWCAESAKMDSYYEAIEAEGH